MTGIDHEVAEASRMTDLDRQLLAQLEGLAIGLEQRGEKSAAHIIRTATKRLSEALSSQNGATHD